MSKSNIITTLVLFTLTITTASACLPLDDELNFENGLAACPAPDNNDMFIPNATIERTPLPLREEKLHEMEALNLGWCKYPTDPAVPTPLPLPSEYDLGL